MLNVHTFPGSASRLQNTRAKRISDKIYKTPRWKSLRSHVIDSEPVCRMCRADGVFTAAVVVDHITPHRGDLSLFWDETNLQPLCKQCHDRKTAAETISPGVVPRYLPEADARVVLVCGAPGSGRLAYAMRNAGPGDTIIDVEGDAAAAAGTARYEAPELARKQSYGRAVSAMRRHAKDGDGVLFVCVEMPQSIARKEWKLYLGDKCKIVVMPYNLDEIPESARGLAISWFSLYTADA